nr:hypothetical protein [Tanacetum cinerariifolium]
GSYENLDIEDLLGVMEYKVDALMKNTISLMGRNEGVSRTKSNEMYQIPLEPSRQEEFEHIVMKFVLDQEEIVEKLEEYMRVVVGDFMQLSSRVTRKLKEKIIEEGSETPFRAQFLKNPTNWPMPFLHLNSSTVIRLRSPKFSLEFGQCGHRRIGLEAKGYRCEVLRSFPVERIEQGNE